MKTEKFQRKPFIVEAVQVTEENMAEVAKWCNGTITETDPQIAAQLKKPVQKWIQVETQQPMNDRQKQAFVGDWLLYANRGFKIYTSKAFERTFEAVFQPAPKGAVKIHTDKKDVPSPKKVAEKIVQAPTEQAVVVEEPTLKHNHPIDARCDVNGCDTDRYLDGVHVFTDVTVKADASGYAPVTA